jgi:pimeloyl-ACP methyl ester carboxylesterase
MDCGASFQLLADALPEEWSLAAIDWRGYGESERRADGYFFTHNLGDLDGLLEQLVPSHPVALIGHSLGGTVAATYAGVRPERVAWLVNLEGFGLTPAPADAAPARHAAWLMALRQQSPGHGQRRYATLDELAGRIEQRNPRLERSHALFLASAWSRPLPDGGFELRADPLHRLRMPIRPTPEEFTACWARIGCPALLLYGAESAVPRRLGRARTVDRWCNAVPATRVKEIGAAGHMLHIEQPDACAGAIVEFARGIP